MFRTLLCVVLCLGVVAVAYAADEGACPGGSLPKVVAARQPAAAPQAVPAELPHPIRDVIHAKPIRTVIHKLLSKTATIEVPVEATVAGPGDFHGGPPPFHGSMPGPHGDFHGGGWGGGVWNGGYGGYHGWANPMPYVAPLIVNFATAPRQVTNPNDGSIVVMTPGHWVANTPGVFPAYVWQYLPMWPLAGTAIKLPKLTGSYQQINGSFQWVGSSAPVEAKRHPVRHAIGAVIELPREIIKAKPVRQLLHRVLHRHRGE